MLDYLVKEHASIRQSASAVEGFASFLEEGRHNGGKVLARITND